MASPQFLQLAVKTTDVFAEKQFSKRFFFAKFVLIMTDIEV